MEKVWKYITVCAMILMSLLVFKLDVSAEKIWNTTGEKTPGGRDFTYKYWAGTGWTYVGDGSPVPETIDISYDVTYNYEEAYKMLEYVNAERRKAGAPELIMKDELMDVAMQRAAECVIYTGHIRPDGSNVQTLSYYIYTENIHYGSSSAKAANASLVNSKGHYEQMINPKYKYVGFGCVGNKWVQIFAIEKVYHENGFDPYDSSKNKPVEWDKMTCYERTNYTETFTAQVNPKLYSEFDVTTIAESVYIGTVLKPRGKLVYKYRNIVQSAFFPLSECNITFGNNKLFEKTDSGFRCVDAGKSTITFSLKDYPQFSVTKNITIDVKKSSVAVRNGCEYQVTNTSKKSKTVTFLKADKSKKEIIIPKTITIGGKKYKVTKIADKAFKDNEKLKQVTIGSNVTKVGKEAFKGCKNLKKITIKSTKLKSVDKNAIKGIHKQAVIKVPKTKFKKYKSLLNGKGQSKQVKIKK